MARTNKPLTADQINQLNQMKQNAQDIATLQKEMLQVKSDIDNINRRNIMDDLQQKKFPGSDKPLYTYDEIATKNGVNRNLVQKTAEQEGLTRRLKLVK